MILSMHITLRAYANVIYVCVHIRKVNVCMCIPEIAFVSTLTPIQGDKCFISDPYVKFTSDCF